MKKYIILITVIFLVVGAYLFHANITGIAASKENAPDLEEAMYWNRLEGDELQCVLCPKRCVLSDGEKGFCKARKNIGGKLYSLTYGKPVAVHTDPIEKKPLFHVYPGSKTFSIATAGCNLRCRFCQNWEISQIDAEKVDVRFVPPEEVIAKAKERGVKTIAFTYTEPIIFYEYMLDIAKLAEKEGIGCIMHSAGYINKEPLKELCKYIIAANIDLKSMKDNFYSTYCLSGSVNSVLEALKTLKEEGVWIEITNLLIPGANDSEEDIRELCLWVKDNLGENTPVHFSRFYPMFRLTNLSPTPVSALERAYKVAKETGLKYVYIGNVPQHGGEDTICPHCGELLVRRVGYTVLEDKVKNGRCPVCDTEIAGIWD